jgi:two-component system NtrC family sensor kinase
MNTTHQAVVVESDTPRTRKLAASLQRRIVAVVLVASLLPLVLLCVGAYVVLGRIVEDRTLQLHRNVVERHAAAIELYLAERTRALELAARTSTLEELTDHQGLRSLFRSLNEAYDTSFVDLGVISATGEHLSYVGPYDLEGRNYASTDWFRSVEVAGSHVSDAFLGFRGVPHRVIAVRSRTGDRPWILKATINDDQFDRLVRTEHLGTTGDAFIINREGVFQTTPRVGRVLDHSPIRNPELHRGVAQATVFSEGRSQLQATTWLEDSRWMLVVRQDEEEVNAPFRRALGWGGLVVAFACLILVMTVVFATRHLTRRIAAADEQNEMLSRDLFRSARLASLGELATGLAHEINNPLAIISAELTNIGDITGLLPADTPDRADLVQSVDRCHHQVERGGAITAKMLQFGRHGSTKLEPTDLPPVIEDTLRLLERQASVRNIELEIHVEPELPPVMLDATELEQVLVNLINNSFQAMKNGGTIRVAAHTSEDQVLLSVSDEGCGIPRENLERIFQPFFTTKPVGHGTGLGLSVCYGLVTRWGGTIEVESELGVGSTFTIRLPIRGAKHQASSRGTAGEST